MAAILTILGMFSGQAFCAPEASVPLAQTNPWAIQPMSLSAVNHPQVKRTVPLAFTATETFDVGIDLGSPVAVSYADRKPFEFDGKINLVSVKME